MPEQTDNKPLSEPMLTQISDAKFPRKYVLACV